MQIKCIFLHFTTPLSGSAALSLAPPIAMRGVTPAALPRWGTAAPDVSKCKKNVKKSLSFLHMSKKSSTFAANFHFKWLVHNSKTLITMAKQSGIHQLRGKVGEMSYYRQTGVAVGLVRAINQAMSGRVKTGDEYANTRLNNAEFGHACKIAGALGASVVPKWRPMILPFSQSKLAKSVLSLIKLDSSAGTTWGTRSLTQADLTNAIDSLNSLAKTPFDRYITDLTISDVTTTAPAREAIKIYVDENADINAYMAGINADRVRIYVGVYDFKVGKYVSASAAYGDVMSIPLGQYNETDDTPAAVDLGEITYRASYAPPTSDQVGGLLVGLVVVPLRTINGTAFELQEYASFKNFLHIPA